MKHLIATLILMSASSAFAGRSSEDLVVATLRDKFTSAQTQLSPLHLNFRYWLCTTYEATKGDFTSTPNQTMAFGEVNGIYFRTDTEDRTIEPASFVQSPVGFMSRSIMEDNPDLTSIYVFRALGNEGVIGEVSVKSTKGDLPPLKNYDPSLSIKGGVAIGYVSCEVMSTIKVVPGSALPPQRKKSIWDRLRGK